ncbi:SDR family oxidoreductase [Pseudomaricurvus sp. HS19]|uniref:SDR family oxidoreductase n=1 Tax=Pseudomaricurvus sp. HS19 TaxID=2692626 RepID=UPI00351A450A
MKPVDKKCIVITGANSGIGYAATQHFARKGDRIIMACRSMDKADKARQEILAEVPAADLTVLRLDVSDLESVQAFARQFIEQFGELDILINNAGIVAIPLQRNSAGHEMQMATNYLGAFALTGLLLPHFRKQGECRIVNVCSLAHRMGKLLVDDLNWDQGEYDQWQSYGRSKVAMMSHTLELNKRLQAQGSNVIALGAHPGFANTNIHSNSPALSKEKTNPVSKWFHAQMQKIIPSATQAAQPIILAAEGADVKGGDYYGPGGLLETGICGKPGKARINKAAFDPALAKQLWEKSEQLSGVGFLNA